MKARFPLRGKRAFVVSGVPPADEFDTDAISTLDRRDFRALRPLHRYPAFRLFPDDAG